MKTAVLTDSASYISPELANKYNITVLPITIIFGNQEYRDAVDISAEEFLQKMASEKQLPSTAQVTMHQMQEAFDDLAAKGYQEVICINLSSGITSFYSNLVNYSKTVKKIKVFPFDSKIASAGEADLTFLAARMAQNGENAKTIMPKLLQLRDSIHVCLVVDDLSHLVRTGRISNTSAFFGNLLKIKPMLTFNEEGKIVPLDKARTMGQALIKIGNLIKNKPADPELTQRISVVNAGDQNNSQRWEDKLRVEFPEAKFSNNQISPAITVHTGEKAMGVLWDIDWQTLSKK